MSPETVKTVREAVEAYKAAPQEFASLRLLAGVLAAFLEDALENEAPHDFKDERP